MTFSEKTTGKTTQNIADMEAQRRELDRQIRAAKRAKKKAEAQALTSAQQALGVDVTRSLGADTVDSVQRLRAVLMSGQVMAFLRQQLTPEVADSSVLGTQSAGADDAARGGGQHAVA